MIERVSKGDFHDAFRRYKRDDFTPRGLDALFEYLEEYEDGTGKELELDVVALCCEFAEFSTAVEAAREYGGDFEEEEDALEWLQENTTTIPVEGGGVIVQGF